jgi:predicted  nucleic acid-binding Zn-ribbon protein
MLEVEFNLLLEHLKAIRGDLGELRDDMSDVKYRLSSLEQQTAGLRADIAYYSARSDPF